MNITNYKRLTFFLCVLIVILAGVVWLWLGKWQVQICYERDTWSAVVDFDMRREQALRAEPKEAVEILDTLVQLPPSQNTNALGRIIEHERTIVIRDIIAYLRIKTGEDLGDDPAKWISKFEK